MRTPAGTGPPADQTAQARAAPPSARERLGEHEPGGPRGTRPRTRSGRDAGWEVVAPSSYRRRRGTELIGTRSREGRRQEQRTVAATHGRDPEPCGPVHGPTTDSRSGEGKTRNGAHHGHLRGFLDRRVTDDVIRRMIDKSRIVHRYVAGSEALS